MNLKEINLNSNDERLLKFLARYKLMLGTDARYFYNSSYYQKRLQKLKNARYISRYNRNYIKLSNAGIRYLKNKEYRCENSCRKKAYIERLEFISKLGLELDKSNIPIKLSWEIKGTIYTNWSRRYI